MELAIAQVNLVVADIDRSRRFYEALGYSFRSIRGSPDSATVAWLSVDGPVRIGLHDASFAAWWDPSSPGVIPGATVVDLDVETGEHLNAALAQVVASGGTVEKEPSDMPWGERFAVVLDPDGYRWGLKAPTGPGNRPG